MYTSGLHHLKAAKIVIYSPKKCKTMYSWLQKKTESENFPNVNLVLSICQLIVYLTIHIK
jgi:hypothetical protein